MALSPALSVDYVVLVIQQINTGAPRRHFPTYKAVVLTPSQSGSLYQLSNRLNTYQNGYADHVELQGGESRKAGVGSTVECDMSTYRSSECRATESTIQDELPGGLTLLTLRMYQMTGLDSHKFGYCKKKVWL